MLNKQAWNVLYVAKNSINLTTLQLYAKAVIHLRQHVENAARLIFYLPNKIQCVCFVKRLGTEIL